MDTFPRIRSPSAGASLAHRRTSRIRPVANSAAPSTGSRIANPAAIAGAATAQGRLGSGAAPPVGASVTWANGSIPGRPASM
jgi:hypothetical protein